MEWPEIQRRIEQGEDERTELKLWAGFPKRVGEAICALANSFLSRNRHFPRWLSEALKQEENFGRPKHDSVGQ